MSRLTETKRAYDQIKQLLDSEIRKKGSNVDVLNKARETLDVAFYLLGWGAVRVPRAEGIKGNR